MSKILSVFVAGQKAGNLEQHEDGNLTFAYSDDYTGIPLSLSMPIANNLYSDKKVRPFLYGLLPDNYEVRKSLGREYGVSAGNPFALLTYIGLDCPGAVQFCAKGKKSQLAQRKEKLVKLADDQIAQRLASGRKSQSKQWETAKERWSLGGCQSKFALRKEGDNWYSCEGSAATTHIFKPGISDLKFEALNEFICLKTAKRCGVPTCEVIYSLFDDEPAIIVSRYDRARDDSQNVIRLHQEDFCQILGIFPDNKYTEEGGPSARDILEICRITGAPAANNIKQFIDMLFINYLLGAPDAHGKNYSLLLDYRDAYLAPLYDVASLLPYAEDPFNIKLAMSCGGENRVGRITLSKLKKFVQVNKLDAYDMSALTLAERLSDLGTQIPKALEAVLAENSSVPGIDELGSRLSPLVSELCKRSISQLET